MRISEASKILEELTRKQGRWLRWRTLVGGKRFVVMFLWESKRKPPGYDLPIPLQPVWTEEMFGDA